MLFLISGASRSGKTIIAKRLLAEKQLPYLSLDWLMMGFNDGIPEYGIHHLLWPNEIAERMWSFLQGMIDNMLFEGVDYVIEGEAMLPELVAQLIKKNPTRVKAVFLGFSEIDVDEKVALVKRYSDGENDWLTKESDEYIKDHVNNMVSYSKMIKAGCEKHGLPYCDTSKDFMRAMERSVEYMTGDLEY